MKTEVIQWLLTGDPSIQFQTERDLLERTNLALQNTIALKGWGKQFLQHQKEDGHWGQKFYQPKWISTHYTLLDLRNLCISPEVAEIRTIIAKILTEEKGPDGGVLPIGKLQVCDVCVNGMLLNYASYFRAKESLLQSIIDFIIEQHMPDGGFNCYFNSTGAQHSSLHSTLSVCEGITEYERNGYTYRIKELINIKQQAIEFMLVHQLFISDRTGEIIHKDFLKMVYPPRWKYNVLRALDYLRHDQHPWDPRMQKALDHLIAKQSKDGTWKVWAKHPGKVHFEMEKAGEPGRWNTLLALRVLSYFEAN